MFDIFRTRLAALLLPSPPPPKAPKGGGTSLPDWRLTATPNPGVQVVKSSFNIANIDVASTYRTGADNATIVNNLCRASPELAASQAAHIRLGIPEGYIAIARNEDGSFNPQATTLALQILRRMDMMADSDNGFSHTSSLRSVAEALAKQIYQTGAMGMELVLDKSRLPYAFAPVATQHIFYYQDNKGGVIPTQRIGGVNVPLNIPTFFYVAIDPDLLDVYPQSPLEPAIQPVLASAQFLSDLRRLCARHIYKRFDVVIDEAKLQARIPPQIAADPVQKAVYLNDTLTAMENTISQMGVEDALVHYDFFTVQYVGGDNGDTPPTLNSVNDIYDVKVATATKTPPSILGQGANSAGLGDTETLVFMINVNGMIRVKLQELFSKAMTLALRLMGQDVTVEFLYDEIELRPKSELQAYRAMKYEELTSYVSMGWMTDEEACLRLTGNMPRPGFTPLVGTQYKDPTVPFTLPNNGQLDSPTSNIGRNRNQTPQQPKGPPAPVKGK